MSRPSSPRSPKKAGTGIDIYATPSVKPGPAEEEFVDSARYGKLYELQTLLKRGVNPDVKVGTRKETALMKAASNGYLDVVKFLVEKCNANINNKNMDGNTSLMFATEQNCMPVVRYLVEEAECDLNLKDKQGHSAVEMACAFGFVRLVSYLISKGATINPNMIPKPQMYCKVTIEEIIEAVKHGMALKNGKTYTPKNPKLIDLLSPKVEEVKHLSAMPQGPERMEEVKKWSDPKKSGEQIKTGWLWKKNPRGLPGMKQWKKRWFILRKKAIIWYENDQSQEPLGAIPHTEMTQFAWLGDEKKDGKRINIYCVEGNIVALKGENREISRQWYKKFLQSTGAKEATIEDGIDE